MEKTLKILLLLVGVVVVVGGGVYVVTSNQKPGTQPTQTVQPNQNQTPNPQNTTLGDTIKLSSKSEIGVPSFLVDAQGMTLYHNLKDFPETEKPPHSACTGDCSITWPAFYASSIVVSAPLKTSDFSVFTRSDGKKQIAYKKWPLYYYAGDNKAGDANGQNIDKIWYIGIEP